MRRKTWALAAAAVLVAATATGGVVVMSGAKQATPAAQEPPANTAKVEQGKLSAMVSQDGTLTYRARSDGSPYAVINQARGSYTKLPENGDKVGCGDVLYRVDDKPVLLLCGTVPAYRDAAQGRCGPGRPPAQPQPARSATTPAHALRPATTFTETERRSRRSSTARACSVTGALDLGDAVFLPESVRIAKVTGELGGSARPGAPVLQATSDTLHVQVDLDPSQQGEVKKGDRAQITLPGNKPVTGKVEGFGRVAQTPAGPDSKPVAATIPTYISLDDPAKARGLDQAPVQVDITTKGVENALSVPVTALVGKSGGGFAVEVVRAGGRRELVAVTLGLFDTAGGRVQVEGDLRAGDRVVVPSL